MNITDSLARQAESNGNHICLRQANLAWTYTQLFASVCNLATNLAESKIKPGDVVALTCRVERTLLIAMLAIARLGATVFSIPAHLPPVRRQTFLDRAGANVLVTDINGLHYPPLNTIVVTPEIMSPSFSGNLIAAAETRAPWLIATGSGSTGTPKLMPVSHRQQLDRMAQGSHWLPYTCEDSLLSLVHLDYYATKQRFLEAIHLGASLYLGDRRKIDVGDEIARGEVSVLYGIPFHIEQILRTQPPERTAHYQTLTALMVGGATVPIKLREKIRDRLTHRLYVLYGSNESHTACITRLAEVFSTEGSVGRPFTGTTLEVVDTADHALPPGEVGSIRLQTPGLIDGYLGDGQATEKFFRNGWFYPGDTGKLTVDGQLVHLGRADDMMIMNGINIYPAEIEQVIKSHPDVADAVACPLKHPVHQDIPVCLVVAQPGKTLNVKSLLDYARTRLGSSSPQRIFVVDQIPRNTHGKIDRETLRMLMETVMEKTSSAATNGKAPPETIARQLSVNITFNFQVPSGREDQLGLWLDSVFTDRAPVERPLRFANWQEVPRSTRTWLRHCLKLEQHLLLAGRVPLFAPPRILSCQLIDKQRQVWQATARFPKVEGLSPGIHHAVISSALQLARWCASNAITPQTKETFFAHIARTLSNNVTRKLQAGKSTFPMLAAAYSLGIPFCHVGAGIFQLGWGNRARRIDRSTCETDAAMGARLAQNKVVTAQLLQRAGLPSPRHMVVENIADGIKSAQRLGWPVVVKPSDRERGEGITVDINDSEGMKTAFNLALSKSKAKQVIVERQVKGVCHRLFIAHGKLLYAVKRLPMSVRGDGVHSVASLVATEVAHQRELPPWIRTEIQPLDDLARTAIANAGYSENSVPAAGVLVPLRRIESTEWGGVDEDVSDRIHPENLRVALTAAQLFNLTVAGIDIISDDIAKPWFENGAIINEVNFSPLLGGGDISRSHIPRYLQDYLGGNGRISVEAYVGAHAWESAAKRQRELLSQGIAACATSGKRTLASTGQAITMPISGLYARTRALLMSPNTGCLLLVIETDELVDTGLPVEWLDHLSLCEGDLATQATEQSAANTRRDQLLDLLQQALVEEVAR